MKPLFSTTQHSRGVNIALSFVALLLGGLIYILLREEEPVFFQWINALGLNQWLNLVRDKSASFLLLFPDWIIFSLPNGLWAFAYTMLITTIWSGSKSLFKVFWMASIPLLVLGFEFSQFMHWIHGIYCIQDVVLGLTGMIIGYILGIRPTKSPQNGEHINQNTGTVGSSQNRED